ncbi:MAG: hypothetical protein B1H09_02485 [Gemmatimonadaceae bacterium 4484_173]|nr:MAG: hypothetical protein B1H09_02485 [Gemmatimonadaceae bacterium 4484_173]
MDKQFFVCHSTADTDLAKALVEELEANGYRCWLASRDADTGQNSEKSVTTAILHSSALLLVFTENSSDSRHIRSELDIAANQRIPIITLKFRRGEVSESIGYYTHQQQWIDCTLNQSNTPEIISALFSIAKTPVKLPQETKQIKWWKAAAAAVLALVLFVVVFNNSSHPASTDSLINTAFGGRDSWDYVSDIIPGGTGGFIAAGGWDWGYWSEIWIAGFNSSGSLVYTWSDSISGSCRPLILPTSDNGCITVFTDFSDADTHGFTYRALRFNSTGGTVWETHGSIDRSGGVQPVVSSLNWLPDSTVAACFTASFPENTRHAVFVAELDGSSGEGSSFQISGDFETLSMAVFASGSMVHVSREIAGSNNTTTELLSPEGVRQSTFEDSDGIAINCVECDGDNTLIAAGSDISHRLTVFKLGKDFSVQWKNDFNGEVTGTVSDIVVLPEGTVILAGSTLPDDENNTDGWVMGLDSSGDIRWQTTVDEDGDQHILTVESKQDGTLLLGGTTTRFGDRDGWLFEMTPDGRYNTPCTLGIDLFSEDWETGFVQQSFWIVGSGENNRPEIIQEQENFALTTGVAVIQRKAVSLVPGLCFEVEVSAANSTATPDSLWVALGTIGQSLPADLPENTDCEIVWNCQPSQQLAVSTGRISPRFTVETPVTFNETKPVIFTIENLEDSVSFRANDSLLFTVPSAFEPDSLRFYINGSSGSTSCRIHSIRVFLRKW